MSQVDISVNGRIYKVTCDNGQEQRLGQLASYFDHHVSRLGHELGQIGDARLMLLAALTVCDELFETKKRLADAENGAVALDAQTVGGASRVIEAATKRVKAIAGKVSR